MSRVEKQGIEVDAVPVLEVQCVARPVALEDDPNATMEELTRELESVQAQLKDQYDHD